MNDLKKVEELLRESRLPDNDFTPGRHQVWRHVAAAQRKRRKTRYPLSIPPWIWAFFTLLAVVLYLFFLFARS